MEGHVLNGVESFTQAAQRRAVVSPCDVRDDGPPGIPEQPLDPLPAFLLGLNMELRPSNEPIEAGLDSAHGVQVALLGLVTLLFVHRGGGLCGNPLGGRSEVQLLHYPDGHVFVQALKRHRSSPSMPACACSGLARK